MNEVNLKTARLEARIDYYQSIIDNNIKQIDLALSDSSCAEFRLEPNKNVDMHNNQ